VSAPINRINQGMGALNIRVYLFYGIGCSWEHLSEVKFICFLRRSPEEIEQVVLTYPNLQVNVHSEIKRFKVQAFSVMLAITDHQALCTELCI
jgi:hypothetical protein